MPAATWTFSCISTLPRGHGAACACARQTRKSLSISTRDGAAVLRIPAPRRGWLRPGRLRLCSQYPFGLFEVWSWINPEFAALVYPRLEANPPPLPRHGAQAQREVERSGGDELAALRTYQTGDPPRNIAWKASARRDELLVKEFETPRGHEVVLDYASPARTGARGSPRATCRLGVHGRIATHAVCAEPAAGAYRGGTRPRASPRLPARTRARPGSRTLKSRAAADRIRNSVSPQPRCSSPCCHTCCACRG